MHPIRFAWLLALLPVFAACAGQMPAGGYDTVLVAGDGSLPVFDNAVSAMSDRLPAGTAAHMRRLSAAPAVMAQTGALSATPTHILATIAGMRPAPGKGCFVFATSHGAENFGFVLGLTDEFISPQDLDAALQRGCGDAPTAVVISACYSGIFARPPMTRPNRVILTAARPDRSSFGCRAGRDYTVYDKCLLDAFVGGGSWRQAYTVIASCVRAEERRERVLPSGPQAWFGAQVADLPLPN